MTWSQRFRGLVAAVLLAASLGCESDPPAAKPVSQDGKALPEGKTADLNNLPKPKGGGRTPK